MILTSQQHSVLLGTGTEVPGEGGGGSRSYLNSHCCQQNDSGMKVGSVTTILLLHTLLQGKVTKTVSVAHLCRELRAVAESRTEVRPLVSL